MQRLLFYCLLIVSNFSIAQKEFKMSSDSLEVIARFDGDDSLIVSVTNLSCDSIYIPTKNILKLFSKDTLVNDCDIQVGFDGPNDCETTSIIHKILPKQTFRRLFIVSRNTSCRIVNLHVSLQFVYSNQFISNLEGMELKDEIEIGDCLLGDESEKIFFFTSYAQ